MPTSYHSKLLNFFHKAEKLKTVLRHSWLSDGRQEDAAQHSWRMALMAMAFYPHIKQKPDLLKTLKMVIIHDLCEVYAGDHWAFKPALKNKHAIERRGLARILKNLPTSTVNEFMNLWEEFEERKTVTAKFARALDKLEVKMQHNETDLKTWAKEEFQFNLSHAEDFFTHDDFLHAMSVLVKEETLKLYRKEKINKQPYQSP